uniref:Pentapeptide repeat-containing protein n=1 Tax=candidate division WOR-3 bacterium TaxID=2052148 RepID=A0A7C6A8K1_UNCW3
MAKCKVERCHHPVSELSLDGCCIFHTEAGKIKGYEKGKPVFIKPDERDEKSKGIVQEFVSQFSRLLEQRKNDKGILVCDEFIFPALIKQEWDEIWRPVKSGYIINLDFSVSFIGANFGGVAYFIGAKFGGEASFSEANFGGVAYFIRANFGGVANFSEANFGGKAYFIGAKFGGEADFIGANFGGEADFRWANFGGEAYFSWANFGGEANFSNTIVNLRGIFRNAKFHKEADFTNAIVKLLDFTRCEIFSFMRMRETNRMSDEQKEEIENRIKELASPEDKFSESEKSILEWALKLVEENVPPIILLRDLRFWENGHLILEDFDVSLTSFWQTNFHIIRPRIDLIRVDWKDKVIIDDIFKRPKESENFTEENKLIYGPIESLNKRKQAEEIERCYRQIRLAYEARGEYPDAGDFYLLEMDARKIKLNDVFLLCLHYLYAWVSNYGESISRAFGWLIGVFLVSTILFAFAGFSHQKETFRLLPQFDISNILGTLKILLASSVAIINAITLGRMEIYAPENIWGSVIFYSARIFGLIILTLLLLAIRRRFRR